MKTIKSIIALFLVTITLNSCSSDDDSSNDVDTNLIVGEWTMTSYTYNTNTTVTAQGQTITTEGEGEGSNFDYNVTFNSDNSLMANGSFDITLTTFVSGQVFDEQVVEISDTNSNGNWSLDGDQLSTTGISSTTQVNTDFVDLGESDGVSSVTTLNETTLVLETDFADAIPEDLEFPDGTEFEITGQATATFTRVN